jgi:hypothetical protein
MDKETREMNMKGFLLFFNKFGFNVRVLCGNSGVVVIVIACRNF